MKLGDKVSIPAPDLSNHQWTARREGTIVSIDGEHVRIRCADGALITGPASEAMTIDDWYHSILP